MTKDKRTGQVVICSGYKSCEAPILECWHKDPHLFDKCIPRLDCEWCGTICKCVNWFDLKEKSNER